MSSSRQRPPSSNKLPATVNVAPFNAHSRRWRKPQVPAARGCFRSMCSSSSSSVMSRRLSFRCSLNSSSTARVCCCRSSATSSRNELPQPLLSSPELQLTSWLFADGLPGGRKFHLRVHVVAAGSLVVGVHRHTLVLPASLPFSGSSGHHYPLHRPLPHSAPAPSKASHPSSYFRYSHSIVLPAIQPPSGSCLLRTALPSLPSGPPSLAPLSCFPSLI